MPCVRLPLDQEDDGTYCLFTISGLITQRDGSREIDLVFNCVAMNLNFPRRCNLGLRRCRQTLPLEVISVLSFSLYCPS